MLLSSLLFSGSHSIGPRANYYYNHTSKHAYIITNSYPKLLIHTSKGVKIGNLVINRGMYDLVNKPEKNHGWFIVNYSRV